MGKVGSHHNMMDWILKYFNAIRACSENCKCSCHLESDKVMGEVRDSSYESLLTNLILSISD